MEENDRRPSGRGSAGRFNRSGRGYGLGIGGRSSNNRRSFNARNDDNNNQSGQRTMGFNVIIPGKTPTNTFDTVEAHVWNHTQKTLDRGKNTTGALRAKKNKLPGTVPTRQTVTLTLKMFDETDTTIAAAQ